MVDFDDIDDRPEYLHGCEHGYTIIVGCPHKCTQFVEVLVTIGPNGHEPIIATPEEYEANIPKYEYHTHIDFGDVARHLLGMQCQYARDYLDSNRHPDLAENIRWTGKLDDYHSLKIHKDDVDAFVTKVIAWRRAQGIIT